MNKSYDFYLPVFKQGDDLHSMIDYAKSNLDTNPIVSGLMYQADEYINASNQCQQLAKILESVPTDQYELFADTHMICVYGPPAIFDQYTQGTSPLLQVSWTDEDDDEEDYDGPQMDDSLEETLT